MSPKLRLCTPVLAVAVLLLAPSAAEAKRCSPDDSPRAYGPTYTTAMSVKGVSCKDAVGLIKRWDKCRKRNGGKDGRCKRPGFRFRCSERRPNVIPSQYDGKVTCKRGSDRVIFRYTQFT